MFWSRNRIGTGIMLILCGIFVCIYGILWLLNVFFGNDAGGRLTGGLWKGPLWFLGGVAAIYIGYRMIREAVDDPGP